MTIGYLTLGKCFPSINEAVDNYYSSINPSSAQASNGYTMITRYQKESGVWKFNTYQISNNVLSGTWSAPTNIYGSCTLENDPTTNFTDGMSLGWGVAGAMILAFAVRRIYRG